ncbi:PREDICTED: uncharacterized protein LOC108563825 isoform X2 [Nicrophorus vespilloides]|uniref:Uncharacterized protein LOC108563825 isoform X2 n=1 Tax=Nicrophorus vespilloides TaxID=110193 RepID=A0ABM1MU55_NICVS|nr:PREDICTED: uncharacterized protein LOC108563825 isoform X2 [Nicrophorus vespilloides]
MKFALIVGVIASVSILWVRGELEYYDEYNNAFSNPEAALISQLYMDPRWRATIAWKNDREDLGLFKQNPFVKAKLSERVRKLEEFVNRRRKQLREAAQRETFIQLTKDREEEYKNKNYEQYQLKYPNQQILDDVRPYPHEENDFSFRDEDNDDDDEGEDEEEQQFEEAPAAEASGKGALGQLKINRDDPVEFGYVPPDPRFYEEANTKEAVANDKLDDKQEEFVIGGDIARTEDQNQYVLEAGKERVQKFVNGEDAVHVIAVKPHGHNIESAGVYIIAIVAGISAAAMVGLIAFAIGWYNLQKHVKNASDVEYPAYGVTGPNKEVSPSGDRRLAQSAQMYHYQHQKQQIIAMEKAAASERHGSISEVDSDEENEEGDYTVYECPGLAPTGEMEVKNPLFQDDPTPAATHNTLQVNKSSAGGKNGDGVQKK